MRRALSGSLFVHAAVIVAAFAAFQWPEAEDAPAPGSVEVELISLATVSSNPTSIIESSAAQSLVSAGAAESVPLTAETLEPAEPKEQPAPPPPIDTVEAEELEARPSQEIRAAQTAQAAESVEAETVEPVASHETLLVATVPRMPVETLAPVEALAAAPKEQPAQSVPETVEPVAEEDVVIAPIPQTLTIARRSEPTYPPPQPRRETPPPQREPRREAPTQAGNGGQSNADVVASRATAGQQGDAGSGGNADVARYPSQIVSKLRRALRYPAGAGGAGGEVHVTFTVAANGAAGGIGIARSSGNTAIDQAGIETVARAAPFPAIPAGAGRQSWTFTVPLAFVR